MEKLKDEIWKEVKGYEKYLKISNLGRIYRIKATNSRSINNKITYGNTDTRGYKYISIRLNSINSNLLIHRLVYQAFKGQLDSNLVIDHINNIKTNNNINNLQQITQSINCSKDNKRNSNYANVDYNKETNRWKARITLNNKRQLIGTFGSEEEAIVAYNDVFNNNNNINKYKVNGTSNIKFDKRSKTILQFTLNNVFIDKYKSISEASRCVKVARKTIKKSCDNTNIIIGNYKWRYE